MGKTDACSVLQTKYFPTGLPALLPELLFTAEILCILLIVCLMACAEEIVKE